MSHNKTMSKLHNSQFNINDKISSNPKFKQQQRLPILPVLHDQRNDSIDNVEILLQPTLRTDIQLCLLICTLSIIDGHQHMQKG